MGLDPTLPVILLLGGGLGLGPIEEAARCLANQDQPCQVVLIAGRNADLEARARALARSTHHPLVVNGLVADMHAWMSVATLAVGKPGGLTTAELLACGVPMIALEPIPGQERANCDALVRHGAGIEATSPTSVAAIAGELLSDPARLQAMRAAAAGMGIRDGARTVAAHVVELAAAPRKALEADPITEMQVAAAEAIHDATELGKDIKKSLGGLFDKLKF